ncbi:hypothetical protein [Phenylobacterium sp.]
MRLRLSRGVDKAGQQTSPEPRMTAIYIIAIFIAVIAVLNRVEFGRFD